MDDVKFTDLSLPQELADEIDGAVKAGEYASPSAVISFECLTAAATSLPSDDFVR